MFQLHSDLGSVVVWEYHGGDDYGPVYTVMRREEGPPWAYGDHTWYVSPGKALDVTVMRNAFPGDTARIIMETPFAAARLEGVAAEVSARRPDLAATDAIAAVLTANPTMTADDVIACLDEAAEEHAANVAYERTLR